MDRLKAFFTAPLFDPLLRRGGGARLVGDRSDPKVELGKGPVMIAVVGAAINGILGVAATALGLVLAAWAVTTHFQTAKGFDAALWAVSRSPVPLGPPIRVANNLIQSDAVITTGISGLFLCLVGLSFLRGARRCLQPPGTSDDGKARMILATAHPRVGQPLEGRLRLAKAVPPGVEYNIQLCCERRVPDRPDEASSKIRTETHHYEEQKVRVQQDAEGSSLPFRFTIPFTAPASTGRATNQFYWRVEFAPADAFITFRNGFDLNVAAASFE